MKKLNEVKAGDTLYCLAYGQDGLDSISIVPVTAKEVIKDGPIPERMICSKEAIVIKEKVPNSWELEGEYVIDQFYHGDECATNSFGIYTTYEEARKDAIQKLDEHFQKTIKEMKELEMRQTNIVNSILTLNK